MKYSVVFVILAIIIIIISSLGIGLIIYRQNPTRYYYKGENSYLSGNYEAAIDSLNEYISYGYKNNNTQKARYYLAASLKNLSKYTLAKRRLLDVINNNTRTTFYVEAIVDYAEICRIEKQYNRFILTKLEDVVHSKPDNLIEDNIFLELGYQYLFAKDYLKAMDSFLKTSSELGLLGRARVNIKLGEPESAFKIYEDFLRFYPSSRYKADVKKAFLKQVTAYALTKRKQKKFVEAIIYFSRIVKNFPDSPESEYALYKIGESYYDLKNYTKALSFYYKVTEDINTKMDDDALYYIGLTYYKMSKFAESYKAFNLLINKYPGSIYLNRAKQWVIQLKKDLVYFEGQ